MLFRTNVGKTAKYVSELVIALALSCLLTCLLLTGCVFSRSGDWELSLSGVASWAGPVAYKVDGELFSVHVEPGETAEEIGPQLTALMKAKGLIVECERYHLRKYYFILRDVREPEPQSGAGGIIRGYCGTLQDDHMLVEAVVTTYFQALNANSPGGEKFDIESMEEPTIGCYNATICVQVISIINGEEQAFDTCLTLTRPTPCDMWTVSDDSIK